MKLVETGSLPIDEIVVENRLRQIDPLWAQGLAEIIKQTGLQHPIEVVKVGNELRLVAGAHRLAAAKILKWDSIPVRIVEPETAQPELEIRLDEIVENVGRRELSALDRAAHVAELKEVLFKLKGETRGGDRKSKSKRQSLPFWSLSDELSTRMGLSERTIRADAELISKLSSDCRQRIAGSWLAENRAQLVLLSKLEAEEQAKILDLMLGEDPPARSIAEAREVLSGVVAGREVTDAVMFSRFVKIWGQASKTVKNQIKAYIAEANP